MFNTKISKTLSGFLAFLLAAPAVVIAATPAAAGSEVLCGTVGTPAVDFLNNPIFSIDSGAGYNANYIGYTVTPSVDVEDLWVGLDGFTGGVVSLSATQSQYLSGGPVASGSSSSFYFLAEANAGSLVSQTHNVTIYEGNPNVGAATPLCSATSTFDYVEETIAANANKVDSINLSTVTGTLGSNVDVTVTGQTGLIGNGPGAPYDLGFIDLSPAAYSGFPAEAWRLTNVEIVNTDTLESWTNVLTIPNQNGNSFNYTATYTFTAVGTTNVAAQVVPVQYIASGTQIKHTGSLPTTPALLPTVANNLTVVKTSDVTTLPSSGGDVTYTVTVYNTGAATMLDQVVDVLPAEGFYQVGSGMLDGVSVEPLISGNVLTFVGPYNVPDTGALVFTYVVNYPATAGVYSNSAVGYVSSTQIDTTADTSDNAPSIVEVTVIPNAPTVTTPVDVSSTGSGEVIYTPVNNTEGSTIIPELTCVVDPADSVCKTEVIIDGEGTYSVDAEGDIVFTPVVGFIGVSSIEYQVSDAYEQTGGGVLNVEILAPAAPTVDPLVGQTPYNTPIEYTPESTNGVVIDPAAVCVVDPADSVCKTEVIIDGEGTYSVDVLTGVITFTPLASFYGTATVVAYEAGNGYGGSSSNTISTEVTVPTPPVVSPIIESSTAYNTEAVIDLNIQDGEAAIGEICIVDGLDCVEQLTVDGEGSWQVDLINKRLVFTPFNGSSGDVTPVQIDIKDVTGQKVSTVVSLVVEPAGATNVTGYVWIDLNKNNVKDPGEPYLPGVEVIVDGEGFTPISSVSGQDGSYSFALSPNSYSLTALLPNSLLDPSWDSAGSSTWVVPLNIIEGEEYSTYFAAQGNGKMSGVVEFDNKVVIPNAQIICVWEGLDQDFNSSDDVTFSFTADSNGVFNVEGLPGGLYHCEGVNPADGAKSSSIIVDVDQNSPVAANATLIITSAPTPNPTPSPVDTLAKTGDSLSLLVLFNISMLVFGVLAVLFAFNVKKGSRKILP